MKRFSRRPTFEILEDRRLLATCHVSRLGDFGAGADLGGGHSRGDLRYCINKANDEPGPDTIDISATGTINLGGPLPELSTDIDIVGPGSALIVRRDSGGNYRIFTIRAGALVRISGLNVSNGNFQGGQGGGIHNQGSLTLMDVRIGTNTAQYGGGIYNTGSLTVVNSQIYSNIASSNGGGIYNTGSLTVDNVQISNTAQFGGGIYNTGNATLIDSQVTFNKAASMGGIYNNGTLLIQGSTVSNNSVVAYGGGIDNFGSATIQYSTIANNIASCTHPDYCAAYGGGIRSLGSASTLSIANSTISNNRVYAVAHLADAYGGGIAAGIVTITSSTISGNEFSVSGDDPLGGGGGMWIGSGTITHSTIAGNFEGIRFGGGLTLRNSIVAKNGGPSNSYGDLVGTLTSSGYNLIGKSAGGSGFVPSDILDVDPLLDPLQNNGGPTLTMALLPGSPAIDSGLNQGAPEWDQRGPGFPRIVNGTIDRGAFEVQATGAPNSIVQTAVLVTADFKSPIFVAPRRRFSRQ